MVARYTDAIYLIAHNDEPTLTDIDEVSGQASVIIIAALFNKSSYDVAWDVVGIRTGKLRRRFVQAIKRTKEFKTYKSEQERIKKQ